MTALTATTAPVGKSSISPHTVLLNFLFEFWHVCVCMQFIEVSARYLVETSDVSCKIDEKCCGSGCGHSCPKSEEIGIFAALVGINNY